MNQKSLLQDFREIVSDFRELLIYQKDFGIEGFPTIPEETDDPCKYGISTIIDPNEDVSPEKSLSLDDVRDELGDCKRCRLYSGRKNPVFGEGNEKARLIFVGEAPGRDEDIRGEPFVGKSGRLLTKIINSINLNREDVYITNIIKCRPPGNRDPLPDEIKACKPFLKKQIEAIGPEIICTLGTFAARTLMNTDGKIAELRGRFHDYGGIKLIPTYHPAFLLRNPYFKRPVWEDMQLIQKEYNH